jgi:hypothetical protein
MPENLKRPEIVDSLLDDLLGPEFDAMLVELLGPEFDAMLAGLPEPELDRLLGDDCCSR